MKRIHYCKLPTQMTVTGRSSSITNAFFNAIIPVIPPTLEEELEALRILEMDPSDICCAYCGDKSTEWDHFRAIIDNQKPTGFITEIANLVPACGKCNQSKGKSHWKKWMQGNALLSPKRRGKADLDLRIQRLTKYENWRQPRWIDFASVVGQEKWQKHLDNWQSVLGLLKQSQEHASEIRTIIKNAHRN